jgi:hypothetical protein
MQKNSRFSSGFGKTTGKWLVINPNQLLLIIFLCKYLLELREIEKFSRILFSNACKLLLHIVARMAKHKLRRCGNCMQYLILHITFNAGGG